jgi:hypothetical protein
MASTGSGDLLWCRVKAVGVTKIRPWPQSGEIIGEHSTQIRGGDVKGLGIILVVLAIMVAAALAIGVLWQGRH